MPPTVSSTTPTSIPSDIDDAHTHATVDRAAGYPGVLLVAQDTTDADFTSPARNGRLGQLAHAEHFGFFVHSALAMTADGLPLGLLHQHVWMRSAHERGKRKDRRHKDTADKESQRWLDAEAACVAALPDDRTVVMIADRECDFYDYFAVAAGPAGTRWSAQVAPPHRRFQGTCSARRRVRDRSKAL